MGNIKDIAGKTFDKWTVIEYAGKNKSGRSLWKCVCECGTIRNVEGSSLRSGSSKCCGCDRSHNKTNTKHGGKKERLYGVWRGIKDRCFNKNTPAYIDYGGRGITMCEEWKDDYSAFRTWSLSNGYNDSAKKGECTLNRRDNNGNYCPDNCEWVDMKAQSNNRRSNHRIEYNGETHTITEWSEITGLRKDTILKRIDVYGWPINRALSECNNHNSN